MRAYQWLHQAAAEGKILERQVHRRGRVYPRMSLFLQVAQEEKKGHGGQLLLNS
jgi:hypothetical protein